MIRKLLALARRRIDGVDRRIEDLAREVRRCRQRENELLVLGIPCQRGLRHVDGQLVVQCTEILRLCERSSREVIELVVERALAIEAIGAVGGQRPDVLAHLADERRCAGQQVELEQIGSAELIGLGVCEEVHFLLRCVIGHVADKEVIAQRAGGCAEICNLRHIGEVVVRHDIQGIFLVNGEDIAVGILGSVELQVRRAHGGGLGGVLSVGVPLLFIQVEEGVVAVDIGQEIIGDLIGGDVHGIVIDLQQERLADDLTHIQTDMLRLTGSFLIRRDIGQRLRAGRIIQSDDGDILVVLRCDVKGAVHQTDGHVLDLRSRVVDGGHRAQARAPAESVPVIGTVGLAVILRSQHKGDVDRRALGELLAVGLRTGPAEVHGLLRVLPASAVGIVEGGGNRAKILFYIDLTGLRIGDDILGIARITDGGKVELEDLIAVLVVQGVARGHILVVLGKRVAEVVVLAVLVGILDGDHVAEHVGRTVGIREIRVAGLLLVPVLGQRALIEHGGIGPVAIEAQHGDGMGNALDTVFRGNGIGIQEGLDISAVRVVGVEEFLLLVDEGERHMDGDAAIGRENDLCSGDELQQLGDIVRVGVAVAVDISLELARAGRDVVEQELCVVGIGVAVLVEVIGSELRRSGQDLAVNRPDNIGCHGHGLRQKIQDAFGRDRSLREDIGREGVFNGLVRKVVQGEVCGVDARAVGIVAELHLDLAVGLAVHKDVALGMDRIGNVGKACALLQDGIPGFGAGIIDGLGRGHQQALGQMTHGDAGLFLQTVFADVLRHEGCHTGDLRSRHGRAAHDLIGLAACHGTVDGIDVAAGSRDLGFHAQIARNTPGAEVAHGVGTGGTGARAHLARDGQLAGVVEHGRAVLGIDRGGGRLDIGRFRLQDADARDGRGGVGQIHADHACLVVADDCAGGARCSYGHVLLIEGARAAEDKGDLAGDDVGIVRQETVAVGIRAGVLEVDILIFGAAAVGRGIERCKGLVRIVAVRGIGVEDLRAVAIGEGVAGRAGIIHGGHAEGVLVGAGGAAGGEVHIVQIQGTRAVNRVFRPAGGIACGDGNDGIGLGQLIQDALILRIGGGKARVAGAERQVHGVTAEHHGVFDGDHVVGIICAAALAEDLHRDELGIGGNALHEHGIERLFIAALAVGDIAVRRGDTGDVGAVLTLFVIIVRDVEVLVHIVERERELAGEIELARIGDKLADVQLRQNSGDLVNIEQVQRSNELVLALARIGSQLLEGILERLAVKGDVVGVRTGVDDGDTAARAGVAVCPGGRGADHRAGGSHVGIGIAGGDDIRLIAVLERDGSHAVKRFDRLDLAIGHVGRDRVRQERHVPDDIERLAAEHIL